MTDRARASLLRLPLVAAILVAVGLLIAWFLVPYVIRLGYAEASFGPINDLFGGREIHPVQRYLNAWRRFALQLSLLGVGILAATVAWSAAPARRRSLINWILGGERSLSAGQAVRFGLALGMLGGIAQVSYMGVRQAVTTRPGAFFHTETLWMAPLSAGLATLLLTLALVLVARGGSGRLGLWKLSMLFGFLAAYGLIQSEGIPLLRSAELLLGLGVASVLARFAVSHHAGLGRVLDRSGWVLAGAIAALLVAGFMTMPKTLERRALRGLPEASEQSPNVLLVILDATRAASMSLHGYARPTTPVLEDWGRSGVVFDQAFSTTSWTLPSHASLFTGLAHSELQTGFDQPLESRFFTLAEALSEVGYGTAGFVANRAYTTAMSGLSQGFARYEDRPFDLANFLWSSWISGRLIARPLNEFTPVRVSPFMDKSADDVSGEFLTWLNERDSDRPFFAFLNFFDAHSTYETPWSTKFGPAPTTEWRPFLTSFRPGPGQPINRGELDQWVNLYDGAIAYIDNELGRIRAYLEATGQLDHTLVIITSDHGESWGERDELEHGGSLYAPSVHIPLLLSFPGHVPAGQRVTTPVSLIDLPSTVTNLIDMESLRAMPGTPLVPLFEGPAPAPHPAPRMTKVPPEEANAEWWSPSLRGPLESVVDGNLQYIVNGFGEEELYDLAVDPLQETDLAGRPEYSADLSRLRGLLR